MTDLPDSIQSSLEDHLAGLSPDAWQQLVNKTRPPSAAVDAETKAAQLNDARKRLAAETMAAFLGQPDANLPTYTTTDTTSKDTK